jgi:outer membrane protein assembly factor BamB
MAGKRVYISCASADALLLDMLSAALDAWEVPYDYLQQNELTVGAVLPEAVQNALRQAEVFLRLCTASTISSMSMAQELQFFNALEVEDRRAHRAEARTLANIILDPGYQREPFDAVTLFIDTAGKSRAYWLDELARPLGVATQARRLGRRSVIVLGLAGGVTALSAVSAGGLLIRNQSAAASASATAAAGLLGSGNLLSGQPAWGPTNVSNDIDAALKNSGQVSPSTGVGTDGTSLYAFSVDTIVTLTPKGQQIGNKNTTFPNILTSGKYSTEVPLPYVGNQVLAFYITDSQGNVNLTVVDSRTRKTLWQKPVVIGHESLTAGPVTVAGSSLYCLFPLNGDWSVCSFDRNSGNVNWSYSIGLGVPHPAVTYASGRTFIGDPYRCTCLDAKTGKKIWQSHLHTAVVATVLISGGLALFGGLDGYFYALDASSGKLRWQTNLEAPISAQAIALGNAVYVGDVTGYLWALDIESGNVYWHVFAGHDASKDPGTPTATILYPPVIYRNLVGVVAGDTLSAIDLIHGSPRWHYQTLGIDSTTRGLATGPVVLGGYFIVGDAQNHIIAINP